MSTSKVRGSRLFWSFAILAVFAVISSSPVDHGCDLGGRVEDGVFDLAA